MKQSGLKPLPRSRGRRLIVKLSAILVVAVLTACAAPIGVEKIGPRQAQREFGQNVLSTGKLSEDARILLRRTNQEEAWNEDPAEVLASLHSRLMLPVDHLLLPEADALPALRFGGDAGGHEHGHRDGLGCVDRFGDHCWVAGCDDRSRQTLAPRQPPGAHLDLPLPYALCINIRIYNKPQTRIKCCHVNPSSASLGTPSRSSPTVVFLSFSSRCFSACFNTRGFSKPIAPILF